MEAVEMSPNFLHILERERAWLSARRQWKQYRGWLNHRNPKRAALEARFGYDTKHALHLLRLMRMGAEILKGEGVQVLRKDREELLAVRDGIWSYEQLMKQAELLSLELRQAKRESALPEQPDDEALNRLCVEICESNWEKKDAEL